MLCYILDSVRNELEVPTESSVILVDLPPGKHWPELWLRAGCIATTTRRVYWVLHPDEPLPCACKHVGTTMALSTGESPLDIRHVYEETR